MKLKFIKNDKWGRMYLTIRPNGAMTLNAKFIEDFGIKGDETFFIGIDEEEMPPKTIFLVIAKQGQKGEYKLSKIGQGIGIYMTRIISLFSWALPVKLEYERFTNKEISGIKLTFKK